eukprot:CAMPEP_0119394524 /NCGR_PEP_ID=MMETSP1334-20130426/129679_1 /TAXON_ID=127549 /ORGANISM="Calcidiscus leptoporus, Strain RCC1130" /LENGTH=58 /DNA_ID=CAMNT_0007417807 /DNA_START=29 /DNA_END=202 /DNA_ORIENTATION=-
MTGEEARAGGATHVHNATNGSRHHRHQKRAAAAWSDSKPQCSRLRCAPSALGPQAASC